MQKHPEKISPEGQGREESFRCFFGGPDRPPRLLRDLLASKIMAVPPGGEVRWVTYYFRDMGLAETLLRAHRQGVEVSVLVEGTPRTPSANQQVVSLLGRPEALGDRFRITRTPRRPIRLGNRRLHEKIYYFSHPCPSVLVGSFNPSGNDPEDPQMVREIGDQDRGHNVLVEITDPQLVAGIKAHLQALHESHGDLGARQQPVVSGGTRVFFYPVPDGEGIEEVFRKVPSESRLRIAVSHLNAPRIVFRLLFLAARGVKIEILAHDTKRRVRPWAERLLQSQPGIDFRRYRHPGGLPMHNKFILLEAPPKERVAFGSLNLSRASLHGNREVLLVSEDPRLYRSFRERWNDLWTEARR